MTRVTARAARKMFAFGTKDTVPSLLVSVSAFESTALPIKGPTIPGTSTCEKMRTPWNIPACPTGVRSRILAPNTAMPARYPHIMQSEPRKTGRVERQRNSSTKPRHSHRRAIYEEKEKPFLSYTFPHRAVTREASTMAGAMTNT